MSGSNNLPADLCSIIMKMDKGSGKTLLGLIGDEELAMVKEPETGLLMMTVRDSFDVDFYLGEVLVSTAEVQYRGKTGYAMLMGDEPERALMAASIEAILQTNNDDLKEQLRRFMAEEGEKIKAVQEKEDALAAKTIVSFESMDRK